MHSSIYSRKFQIVSILSSIKCSNPPNNISLMFIKKNIGAGIIYIALNDFLISSRLSIGMVIIIISSSCHFHHQMLKHSMIATSIKQVCEVINNSLTGWLAPSIWSYGPLPCPAPPPPWIFLLFTDVFILLWMHFTSLN